MSNELILALQSDPSLASDLLMVTLEDKVSVPEVLAAALGDFFLYRRDIIADVQKRRRQACSA